MAEMNVQRTAGWGVDEAPGKPLSLPLSVQQQQLQLARKQQLVQAMMGQQLQDKGATQMAGNIAIKKSPFEALSQALSAGLLANKQKELDTKGQKIGEDYNALGQREAMEADELERGGKELTPAVPGREAVYEAPADLTPGVEQMEPKLLSEAVAAKPTTYSNPDAKAALAKRLMAQHPDVRAIGIAQQKAQEARRLMQERRGMEGLTDQEAVKFMQDPTSLAQAKGKSPVQAVPAGSTMLGADGKPIAPLGPEARRTQFTDAKGDMYEFNPVDGSVRKLDNMAKNNININTAEKQGAVEAFKLDAKTVDESLKNVKDSIAAQRNINTMAQNDRGQIISGTLSEERTSLARAFGTLGMSIPEETLANTEAFKRAATQAWQDCVKKYGGNRGLTQLEAAELKNLGPQGWMSPRGRQLMYKAATTYHQQVQDNFRNTVKSYQKVYAGDPAMQAHFGAVEQDAFGPEGKNVGFDDGSSQPAPQQNAVAGATPPLVPGAGAQSPPQGAIPFDVFMRNSGQGQRR
jgi:hypothetical protein